MHRDTPKDITPKMEEDTSERQMCDNWIEATIVLVDPYCRYETGNNLK